MIPPRWRTAAKQLVPTNCNCQYYMHALSLYTLSQTLLALPCCAALQENNAVAVLDIRKAVIRSIHGLGFKDHSFAPNALDASDRDGPGTAPNNRTAAILKNWPLFGMYQPDEIKAYRCVGHCFRFCTPGWMQCLCQVASMNCWCRVYDSGCMHRGADCNH